MKEIIFWFNFYEAEKYWFNYAIGYLKSIEYLKYVRFSKFEHWIEFLNLRISFKVNIRGDVDMTSNWDKNQYWVEDLFYNNFECFFKEIIKENINA